MDLYVVVCSYYYTGIFGVYSTIKRARIALENALDKDKHIVYYENIDERTYQFTTTKGRTFSAEICLDFLDIEFEEGTIKEVE